MIVPYNIEKIVRDTKYFDFDTVAVALELYKKLGLIYEQEDGNLKITDVERMIGSESASREAIKKREQRLKKKIEGTQEGTNCLIENRDKSIDIRYKILDNNKKEIYKEKEKYGEFKNVLLTDEEYHKLEKSNLLPYIEKLSSYIASKNKKYKSHYATILTWSRKDNSNNKSEVTYDII